MPSLAPRRGQRLESFYLGQRVRIIGGFCTGHYGRVSLMFAGQREAFVNVTDVASHPFPERARRWPDNDPDGRGNWVEVVPEECEQA